MTLAPRASRRPGVPARSLLADEQGVALVVAMMAMVLLTALGLALVLVTNTETMISANFRDAQETLYAADAGVETAMQDLLLESDWNRVLAGAEHSGFFDAATSITLSDGSTLNLETLRAQLQAETDTANIWGTNDPTWQFYARGPASELMPGGTLDSNTYILVFVGDDPSETDANPAIDTNGVLTLHVEAYGLKGSRKVLEVTVARTSSVEIERGYIAQRGQEELNQRARKAAVQNPGRSLTEMRMSLGSGGLAVQ